MLYFYRLFLLFLFISCSKDNVLTATSIKNGKFKSTINDGNNESTFIRNDSIQTETYNNKIFTYKVKWNSDFEYELLNINPTTALDSTPFVVKVTGIHKDYYTFIAYYKGSKFKQKGKTYKLK